MAATAPPASFSVRLLKSLPVVALGIWTFLHINAAVGDWMGPIMASCQAAAEEQKGDNKIPVISDVVAGTRFFVCLMIPFFTEGLRGPLGRLIWGMLLAVGYNWTILASIEGSRVGARWLITWVPVFKLLATVIGISVVIPLLWLPAYFFSSISDKTPEASAKAAISPLRVAAIGALSFAELLPNVASLLPVDAAAFPNLLAVMLIAPIVLPLLYFAFPSKTSAPQKDGHRAAVTLYHVLAGTCLVWHLVTLSIIWKDPQVGGQLATLIRSHPGGASCQYFLLVDTFVMWVGLLYYVLLEESLATLLYVIGGSVIVGPGAALAFYLARREESIAQRAVVHNAVKKIK